MLDFVRYYLFAFGAFTIAGGVMGYVKAKSGASITAGSVFGVLLFVAGYLATGSKSGLWLGLAVSLMLAGRFSTAFRKSGKVMPAGIMALLGLVGTGLTLVSLAR